jgi:hypothetical protein
VASRVRHNNPNATFQDVAKAAQYVVPSFVKREIVNGKNQFTISPGLTLNPDFSITPAHSILNPALSTTTGRNNIEAAAKYYFDMSPKQARLGHNGNSDYTNYYADSLISSICQGEMSNPDLAGRLTLDMQGLKLQKPLLAQNGIDLGGPGARCTYYEKGSPQTPRHFDHTADSHRYTPERFERPQTQPQQSPSQQSQPQSQANPGDDTWARVDRMLAAADRGDWQGFRADTQALAAMPAAQEMREHARTTVDLQAQQQKAAQQSVEVLRQQQAEQQQDAPATRISR